MIDRYANQEITKIWTNENKVMLWQKTELAVIQAMVVLGDIKEEESLQIKETLDANPIDIKWWLEKEAELRHDYNAFVEERRRFLPPHLQRYFHELITSYDGEEPAFSSMLKESIKVVRRYYSDFLDTLVEMAKRYRFTIMNGRTHGQEAKLQSFGKRILTWIRDLRADLSLLDKAEECLQYSKLSGAVGNYGSFDPELESKALETLGFKPYYGATQIMPREIYVPLAEALCQIVLTLDKIALSIRLGARSGRPIMQEPFAKTQTGSSTMPHKKNTINTEQIEGMSRMAKGFLNMIVDNVTTWEERAIEQSCVERVAWPDLFHVVIRSLRVMTQVLKGLAVYSDNMLLEVVESRGTYASDEAKEVIKELGEPYGLTVDEGYRIIQLAAFNASEPGAEIEELRRNVPPSFSEADGVLERFQKIPRQPPISIRDIISEGSLKSSSQLDITGESIQRWNEILKQIFSNPASLEKWNRIFLPSYLLRNEAKLYKEILGV